MTRQPQQSLVIENPEVLFRVSTRRAFLKLLGAGGTIVLLPSIFAATSNASDTRSRGRANGITLDLSTDPGILNYAYTLEQLEAAFYTAVLASPIFKQLTADQKEVFTDLRNHEVVHREFFRAALGSKAIGTLALHPTAASAAIANSTTTLRNAESFEDLGVAAYNGAGKYLKDPANLLIAGKIVSVEARHAAAIRDMRDALGVTASAGAGTRFAGDDVVKPPGDAFQGLDVKLEPSAVLSRVVATGLVATPIVISKPPAVTPGTPDFGPPSPTP